MYNIACLESTSCSTAFFVSWMKDVPTIREVYFREELTLFCDYNIACLESTSCSTAFFVAWLKDVPTIREVYFREELTLFCDLDSI